MKAYTDEKIL